ncbi:hypothetical protein [Candidatus Nitrosocosmicus arcticus]|nr:hypothetical protein [Candidatus Nitrosocosmicus arcticus]
MSDNKSLYKSHDILKILNWNITKIVNIMLLPSDCLNTFLIKKNVVTLRDPLRMTFTILKERYRSEKDIVEKK